MLELFLQQLSLFLSAYVDDERGQDLIEYALIIVLVVLVAVAALTMLGGRVSSVFRQITYQLR
ncbi:MAG TPA: Flp family type IVb pilin [Anaerolineae bacterium]|nr:Flp family type IVb pilin [Anaerolineae bacterium]